MIRIVEIAGPNKSCDVPTSWRAIFLCLLSSICRLRLSSMFPQTHPIPEEFYGTVVLATEYKPRTTSSTNNIATLYEWVMPSAGGLTLTLKITKTAIFHSTVIDPPQRSNSADTIHMCAHLTRTYTWWKRRTRYYVADYLPAIILLILRCRIKFFLCV